MAAPRKFGSGAIAADEVGGPAVAGPQVPSPHSPDASVTAPGIPNELVLSTSCFGARLEAIEDQAFAAVAMGFRQIELGLADSPPKLNGFEDTRRETGVKVTSIVAGCLKPRGALMSSSLLGSCTDTEREQAMLAVRRHIQLAQRMGAPVVILRGSSVADAKLRQESEDLAALKLKNGIEEDTAERARALVAKVGKKGNRQIEHLCRSLYALLSEFPDTRLAIEPGHQLDDLLSFEALGWVLADLKGKGKGLGYWHDVGHVHERGVVGLPGQGAWLDAYADRMFGAHLQDASDNQQGLPPGLGQVDFKLVAEYVPKTAARVLDVHSSHGRSEILASVQFLTGLGF
jgi:sugar phosphate isomerase/epimerase